MYLPKGEWYDFWTREKISGGKWIEAPAPLDRLPLFVRAGAVIPMQQVVQYTDQAPADPLTFEIFPSAEANGSCYEDDGISFGYKKGIFRATAVKVSVSREATTIKMIAARGSYLPSKRSVVFALNGVEQKPKVINVGSEQLKEVGSLSDAAQGWSYDRELHRLSIKLPDSQTGLDLSVQ